MISIFRASRSAAEKHSRKYGAKTYVNTTIRIKRRDEVPRGVSTRAVWYNSSTFVATHKAEEYQKHQEDDIVPTVHVYPAHAASR
jgi:hypothetical protein